MSTQAASSSSVTYKGRFAPSPTGALHAGSLVAALASWLDARAHNGLWLLRIEDVDTPRCLPGMGEHIVRQLARCCLIPDAVPVWQSQRTGIYDNALAQLQSKKAVFPCACTRKDIENALRSAGTVRSRHSDPVYPGTCRTGLNGRAGRAWRLRVADEATLWHDRRLGPQQQNVALAVGDFVLKRSDGLYAYQLAVVVDDAAQGVTHVVRGEDLADNTARQIVLQQALGLPLPRYLHTPLVLAADGQKLSKQNGAAEVDTRSPAAAFNSLCRAAATLGLDAPGSGDNTSLALGRWTAQWRSIYTSP